MFETLFPEIKPREHGFLRVSQLHSIYWERSGNPSGLKILVVHGGPGGGSQSLYRRYFDPEKFDIIQFDQRGCGNSLPHSELRENTTLDLIKDIEKLRSFLGINSWHLFGGSWGSTLSLVYAINYPKRVLSMILRGIFLCRKFELEWFYQKGASEIFPEEFEQYKSVIPEQERDDLIRAFYQRLTSSDKLIREKSAYEWTRWEMATSNLIQDKLYLNQASDKEFSDAFARIECHYFMNNVFLEENYILRNIQKLRNTPLSIVQGRYDIVCPVRSAWDLKQALPSSHIYIIPDAGHSLKEAGISERLIKLTNELS